MASSVWSNTELKMNLYLYLMKQCPPQSGDGMRLWDERLLWDEMKYVKITKRHGIKCHQNYGSCAKDPSVVTFISSNSTIFHQKFRNFYLLLFILLLFSKKLQWRCNLWLCDVCIVCGLESLWFIPKPLQALKIVTESQTAPDLSSLYKCVCSLSHLPPPSLTLNFLTLLALYLVIKTKTK